MEQNKHLVTHQSAVRTKSSDPEEDLSRREKDFLTYFGYLNDRLINHFSCACQSATDFILYHGRMFITERYICFSSHIIKEYLKVIPFSDVTNIVKKNTALVFSNAIGVTHKKGSEFFTSFLHRDKVFDLINTLWRKNKGEESLGINLRSLIKQEQASKPQPDNSIDARKLSLADANIDISLINSNNNIPNPSYNSQSNINNENIESQSSTDQQKSKENSSSDHFNNNNNPNDTSEINESFKKEKKRQKNTTEHPLDLNLLKSGKPKKAKRKIVKQDDTIPPEILKEIEMEEESKRKKPPQEIKEEEKEEEMNEPSEDIFKDIIFPNEGKFNDHVSIDNDPCINQVFPNVTPKEFYAKLLYSAKFWEHVFVVTDSTDINIPEFKLPNDGAIYLERVCKFVAPIKGAPMGPKQTRVEQTHRVSIQNEDHIVFDTSNVSLDIPMYSDAFVVESLWSVVKEGTGSRLQIRWKVRYLKSVWVKGMIEKNAKVATEEFYRVWADEAQKELTKKKENPENRNLGNIKNDNDEELQNAINSQMNFQAVKGTSSNLTETQNAEDLIDIPLIGIKISISTITLLAVIMLLLCGGTYFCLRIHFIHSNIDQWKNTHFELEDRLIFLQSIAARLAMNFTSISLDDSQHKNLKISDWKDWRRNKLDLGWHLSEWQDEILHLQQTLSGTLVNVGNILEYSSTKKLGVSEKPLMLSTHLLENLIQGNSRIIEVEPASESSFFWLIFFFSVSIIVISTAAFFLMQ